MSKPSGKRPLEVPSDGPTNLPSVKTGYTIVVLAVLFFIIVGYVTFFSAFIPSPPNFILEVVVEDTHYKYLALFLIPTFSYFVIANWVGWQYYQNS
ncbi:hypothetical protein BDM02DRAFT_3183064 [Thelephora ganbajun]|uniref:Uncharacterized protein n=1 Tax=Thelephora ganbajun TaxID=370292 RepID=A0ACB6ZTY8_THEGA|nr:hypothetical protein BDM02DRAFT_3183064 [Thelephora ganbajun]